jgi:hypothetical protein
VRARPLGGRAKRLPTGPPCPLPARHAPHQAFAEFAKKFGLKSPSEFLSPRYEALLARVGGYHIHDAAALKAADLKDGQSLTTLVNGAPLTVQK